MVEKKKRTTRIEKKQKYLFIAGGVLLLFLFLFGLMWIKVKDGLPAIDELENPKFYLASKVFDKRGELLGHFYIENRVEIQYNDLPKNLIEALVSTEDKKFFDHWGVDVDRIFKSAIKTIFLGKPQGASTLTQQLARNLYKFKDTDENSFDLALRKVREWITAVQIEKSFSKTEILTMYLNFNYFGRRSYGIESAAKNFFGISTRELTPEKSALLVAMLKSPTYFDPIRYPERSLERRNLVLRNMLEDGFLTDDEYQKYSATNIELKREKKESLLTKAPYFLEYLKNELIQAEQATGIDVLTDGLNIYTTLDLEMQYIANKVVKSNVARLQKGFDGYWSWAGRQKLLDDILDKAIKGDEEYQILVSKEEKQDYYKKLKNDKKFVDSVKHQASRVQAAFVVLEVGTGHILSMVGGTDTVRGFGLNHVTQIRRQPGSSYKPIMYATAIEKEHVYPQFKVSNEPLKGRYSPKNSDGSSGGIITIRKAITGSVNIVAVRMITDGVVSVPQIRDIASKMGLRTPLADDATIALGSSEVVPLELAGAYSVFPNKGMYIAPNWYKKIVDRDNAELAPFNPSKWRAISEESAVMMISMLQDVVTSGTGASLKSRFSLPAAGKTGTTQNFTDAWFAGFTPRFVAVVWIGFDDARIKYPGGYGGTAALPIWGDFMAQVYAKNNYPKEEFPVTAPNLIKFDFCGGGGVGYLAKAGPGCPVVKDYVLASEAAAIPVCERTHVDGNGNKKTDTSGSEW
ncbi:MAG: PBP1A family penicillin-binding protein [Ignavibacteriales bacterium]|mgnify:CR=1 FL=1|jgi:penicillin-binding protein 1A|nr:PBP1A family penicillin-binding protein [Ignavibacteriales bacterium]